MLIKETDPVARHYMEIAEERLGKYNDSVKADLDGILNPKYAERTFKLKLAQYT